MVDQSSGGILPDPVSFASPPVTRVILGVEFAGPVITEPATLADFWTQIRDEFPDAQRQQRLAPMAEVFDLHQQQPRFEFQVGGGETRQRYVFRNEVQNLAVQVQEDRFSFSWQRVQEDEPYPRYRWVRERFHEIYKTFMVAADEELLAKSPPNWCATTYTNEITHPDSTDPYHGPLEDILQFVHKPDSEVLPPVEDTVIRQRRLLRDDTGDPCGRLYIQTVPTLTPPPESRPGYDLTLRVVAQPSESGEAGVFACQDRGRDLIVRSFKDITTEKMHKVWELQEEEK